jgi:purine nucleoside phosphorylase
MEREIPEVGMAVIGGSAIMGSGFPAGFDGVEVIREAVVFETPFGPTAPFTHASVGGREFLYAPFHGITREIRNTEPDSAGERVFIVLMRAGVRKIIGCALCGSTNRLLDQGDAVIPDGFVDYTTKRTQSLTRSLRRRGVEVESTMYRLIRPFCPGLSRLLVAGCGRAGVSQGLRQGRRGRL